MISLHQESLYLQGARDLLLRIQNTGGTVTYNQGKDSKVYDKAVFDEILHNRESLVKFMRGDGWRYYDHQRNKKNKLEKVKVKFDD